MKRLRWICAFLVALFLAQVTGATAAELSNRAFQIQYDGSGIRSLKRTNDLHDTEYLAANGILGSLVIRYRSTANGHWRELRDLTGLRQDGAQAVSYQMGTLLPTLAAKSTASAATGAGGLRALNDGQVPVTAGRGAGAGGRGGGPGAPGGVSQVPMFTWAGSRGETQWVQYAFPTEEEVSRVEVFWVANPADASAAGLPQSWRLLYRSGRDWKEVQARTPYGLAANAFNLLEFAPVKTSAMRIEVRMAPNATVGLAEWRAGPEQIPVPPADLKVNQTFKLDGEVLDWTVTLANDGATGGGFVPEAMGRGWIGKQMARGAWYYSAEEDVGYCGALRTHATIVARDSVFGEIAYGGLLTRQGSSVRVIPRDGLRVRFHVIRDDQRLHMVLDHDGYAKEQPIVVDDGLARIQFTLENRTGGEHQTGLRIAGLPAGEYAVTVGGRAVATVRGGASQENHVALPVSSAATVQVTIARTAR